MKKILMILMISIYLLLIAAIIILAIFCRHKKNCNDNINCNFNIKDIFSFQDNIIKKLNDTVKINIQSAKITFGQLSDDNFYVELLLYPYNIKTTSPDYERLLANKVSENNPFIETLYNNKLLWFPRTDFSSSKIICLKGQSIQILTFNYNKKSISITGPMETEFYTLS